METPKLTLRIYRGIEAEALSEEVSLRRSAASMPPTSSVHCGRGRSGDQSARSKECPRRAWIKIALAHFPARAAAVANRKAIARSSPAL
jgi:hypothetical protein